MAEPIKVPAVGESITEGVLARWLKKDGDTIRRGEPLYTLETDKATQDVPSPSDGVLSITVPEGSTVKVESVVGQIEKTGKAARAKPQKDDKPAPAAEKKPVQKEEETAEPVAMPAARHLAAESGVDLHQVHGTGREGRILKEDVAHFLQQEKAPPPPPPQSASRPPEPPPGPPLARKPGERETRERMSTLRQRIATRLVEAQTTAAILTTFNEIDMSAVMALRSRFKEAFQKKHGVGLGFMSFFVKAAVEALKAFPIVNARIEGSDIVYAHCYDLGVAVSTERGLMVPVIRGCDAKSFSEIEKEIAALAQKARDGKISVADLQGGTFTITNGGVFGSLLSTPILNPPQSAILGMHAIQKRPIASEEQVVIRPMMYVALSYDHRLVDGREAVIFLVRIKELIEAPERLLLEV